MGMIGVSSAIKNFKMNFWLVLSSVAALGLFFVPTRVSFVFVTVVFILILVVIAFGAVKPTDIPICKMRIFSVLFTILITCAGFFVFKSTWTPSSKVASVANSIGMNPLTLILIVDIAFCVIGLYAMQVLSRWIILWLYSLIKEYFLVQQKSDIISNFKRNWWLPISASAFYCLYVTQQIESYIGFGIAFFAVLIVSTQIQSVISYCRSSNGFLNIISLISAIGICLAGQEAFCKYRGTSEKIYYIGIIGALVAVFFIYFCVLAFWKNIVKILRETKFLSGVKVAEWIIYGSIIVMSIIFIAIAYNRSEAFYAGTKYLHDIIYTSDSPSLMKGNAYLVLKHPENDLRQPLFAVFSAPFVGFPFLVARLMGASVSVQAMLVNGVQIVLLLTANFMIAKMMKLDSVKRVCFVILTVCTYTQMLFTLMMEQYIIAYFWLAFCMYLFVEKQYHEHIALWGAGGTLLTSIVFLLFMSNKSPIKNFKAWFTDMVKYGLEFIIIMLVFYRFDIIYNLISTMKSLSRFSGKTVTFTDKIYQYSEFVRNCFVAPKAGINTTSFEHISWQQNTVVGISFIGVLILVLVCISAVLNRKKRSSLMAAGWVGFSVVMLFGLGWGTVENGLILYALYFGWAFIVLLFQLIEKIENMLNIKFLMPILTICAIVTLLTINMPAIMEMLDFAITYYPV